MMDDANWMMLDANCMTSDQDQRGRETEIVPGAGAAGREKQVS